MNNPRPRKENHNESQRIVTVPYISNEKSPHQQAVADLLKSMLSMGLLDMLEAKHAHIGQLHLIPGLRTTSARNYDSALVALRDYVNVHTALLPTKGLLERWRDDMLMEGLSVNTINARLSAARKLLRAVADDIPDLTIKTALRDWATVENAKAIKVQDKVEEDYGKRLTLDSLQKLVASIPTDNIKGLRDRAMIALAAGAGLRVSEIVALTLRELFLTTNEGGQRGIRIRKGKHGKSRIVVVDGWNSWVIQATEAYIAALGLTPLEHPDERVFRGVKREKGSKYTSNGTSLSDRNAQAIFNGPTGYKAEYNGKMESLEFHDLRRTFAKLCRQAGMSWDALREQMGHESVMTTESYVGHEVDWSERIPNWTIKL